MDYEMKYKAVLKTATQWIKDGCTDKERICLVCVFPELAESEDERTRKWLVDYFKSVGKSWIHRDISPEQILSYLEKQKEPHWKPSEDLNEAAEKYASGFPFDNEWQSIANNAFIAGAEWQKEQPEVDLEKASRNVYESWMGGTMNEVRRDMVELGKVLNARKEDKQ